MYRSVFVTLVAIVSFTIAYDFSDSTFNNYLYEQINIASDQQFELPTLARRSRRGVGNFLTEKCGFHSKINCCGAEEVVIPEEHKVVKEACFAEHFPKSDGPKTHDPFSCENIKAMKNKVACAMNCVAEKFKMIENGEPNADNIKSIFEAFADEDWKKGLVSPVIEKCIPIAKSFAEAHPAEDGNCSFLGVKLMHCLWRTWQLDCPADKLQTTPRCTKLIEVLNANTEAMKDH